jgi:glyoxylase I family protein
MPAIHHVAITVSDFEQSLAFYERLGFKVLFTKDTPEKQKHLALMGKDDLKLEVFHYENTVNNPGSRDTIGNNVKEVGQKHFALRTDSIENTQKELEAAGIALASQPNTGDAGYHFFFIRDPDGIWIEYVQDDKY